MSKMSDRINQVVEASGLSKTEFAQKINLSQSMISKLCSGASTPSDRTISDICREFGVDLIWLETGIGEMFREQSSDERLAFRLGKIMASADDDIHKRFVAAITEATAEELIAVEQLAARLLKE